LGGGEVLVEIGMVVLEGAVEAAAEAGGEGLIVDEETVAGGAMEGFVFGMEGGGGNDEVDVGVVLDLAAPGVQHAGEAEFRAVVFGGADVLEGGGALAQEEWIEDFGMDEAEVAQFLRQGEGDHEVGHGQEPGFLFGGPDLLVEGTAPGAGAVVAAVVGVVLFLAAAALIEPPAEGGRAAREDAPHGPVVVGGELVAVGMGVVFPMRAEQVCQVEGHGANGVLLDSGQGAQGVAGLGLADLGEVEIDEGGLEGGVAEVGGDLPQAGAGVQHVGGVAVTQGVGADFVVLLGQSAFGAGDVHGGPGAGVGHGPAAVVEGLLEGDAGTFPAASGRGKEPVGIAVPGPEAAQADEQFGADRDFAGLAALAVDDTQDEACAVDVLGADLKGFAQAQAALIDEGEVGAVTAVAEGAQEFGDFLAGEDVGQWLDALDVDFRPDFPRLAEVVAVEGAQGADGLVEGGTGELAFGLEVDEEVKDLGGFKIGERGAGEMIGKLGGPAEVGLDRAAAQSFELDEAQVVLIPLGGGDVPAS
jgi:hypothetical protein